MRKSVRNLWRCNRMKNFKNSVFYIVVTSIFSVLIYFIIQKGKLLENDEVTISSTSGTAWTNFLDSLSENLHHPLAILLIQIIAIIIIARIFGWIFRKIGQPSVIGEMIAGIVLGPSLFGLYFPEYALMLFPIESLGNLHFLSQIGLILFMFVIGMELDLKSLKNKANDAVVISHASIIFPFTLGIGLAYFIYDQFAPAGVDFTSFSLFLGISMSITAFPVLARIVQERGIHKTKLGTIVITCAAADDITAWCALAAVIAIVKAGSVNSAIYVIILAIIYVLLMIKIVRPFLSRISEVKSQNVLSKSIVGIFFITLIISSFLSEIIGIHALFGAFMAGAIMPDNTRFRNAIIGKVEDFAVIILLPLFFVFTGLRTQLGLLDDPYQWKITAIIIGVAVVGKFLGSALAAKFVGQNWRDSLTIGALMNTRGLMELIVLNIGYDLGVLSAEIFTMMVIMALVTTFMTGPALNVIDFIFRKSTANRPQTDQNSYKILFAFGNPLRGKSLLKLANSFVKNQDDDSLTTALHLTLSTDVHSFNLQQYEDKTFAPIVEEADALNQKLLTLFKISYDIDSDIVEIANQGNYDLLLVGLGKSIFEGTLLGKILGYTTRIVNPDRLIDKFAGREGFFENSPFDDRTRQIIARSRIPVGLLVDKNLQTPNHIFLPIFAEEDLFLLKFAQKLIENTGAKVSVFLNSNFKFEPNFIDNLKKSMEVSEKFSMVEAAQAQKLIAHQDLILISIDGWRELVDSKSPWLAQMPSILIMKA